VTKTKTTKKHGAPKLAHQEGLFCTVAHTRFRAVAVGGHGPDFVIAKATTRGFHQSVLSKQLSPQ